MWSIVILQFRHRQLYELLEYTRAKLEVIEDILKTLEHEIEQEKDDLNELSKAVHVPHNAYGAPLGYDFGGGDHHVRNSALLVHINYLSIQRGKIPSDIKRAERFIKDCKTKLAPFITAFDPACQAIVFEIQSEISEMQDVLAKLRYIQLQFAGWLHAIINA